jgi:hypothetical protein
LDGHVASAAPASEKEREALSYASALLTELRLHPDPRKEYNIDIADFAALGLGKGVVVYDFEAELPVPTGVVVYPVYEGGVLMATLQSATVEKETTYILGEEFVDGLSIFLKANTDAAILLNSNYVIAHSRNGNTAILFNKLTNEDDYHLLGSEFAGFENLNNPDSIFYTENSLIGDIPVLSEGTIGNEEINLMASQSGHASLDVPWVSQNQDPICWAACAAMVGQYMTDIKLTAREIADALAKEPQTVNLAVQALDRYFHYPNGASVGSKYLARALTDSEIMQNISSGLPVITDAVKIGTAVGDAKHAVVISGYSSMSSYPHVLSINNPGVAQKNQLARKETGSQHYNFSYNGSIYQWSAGSYILTGWQMVDGLWKKIRDDASGLSTPQPGWQTINVYRYYFLPSGSPAIGPMRIGNDEYFFNNTGALIQGLTSGGVYTISSSIGSTAKLFDITNASTSNGAVLQTYPANRTPAQRFRLTLTNDGYCIFINVNSNKALDVPDAKATGGKVISQYTANGTDAQKWTIMPSGKLDGSVCIAPKLNPLLRLSVVATLTAGSTQVQLQVPTTSQASSPAIQTQVFKLQKIEQILENVYYTIEVSYANRVLDVAGSSAVNGINVQLYQSNATLAQVFLLSYDKNTGYYTIRNYGSGMALDVAGAGTANGTNVRIWTPNATYAQRWAIERVGNYYRLYSACNGLALDVAGAGESNGANIQMWTANGTKAQNFILTNRTRGITSLPDGVYTINATHINLTFDVAGGSTANGANIQLHQVNGSAAQKFRLTLDRATDRYIITNIGSGKALDVAGAGTTNGTNVQVWDYVGANNQSWVLFPVDSIHYRLSPFHNLSLALDAAGAGTKNGTNVQVWAANWTNAQMWRLVKIG